MRRQHYTQSQDHHFCRDCDRLFSSEELRIKHSATKHLYCRAHDTTFKSEDDLVSHYRQSLEHPFCVTCECNFDNENALWVHSEKDHHACGQCRKLFDSHEGLQEHDRNKHDFCTDCKRGFQSASDLRHHLTIEHAAAKNWYYQFFKSEDAPQSHNIQSLGHHFCPECKKVFDDEDELWEHAEDDHDACCDCHELFDSIEKLQEHDRDKHNYCTDCEMDFCDTSKLRHHLSTQHMYCQFFQFAEVLRSHYRYSLDHHFCLKCENDFDDEDKLWEHAGRDHHACQVCREMFDSHEELQAHNRDVHFYCTECKRSFQSESNIRHHLDSKLHQPINVQCPGHGCGLAFVSRAALVMHFESGACSSRMTRKQLNRLAVHADTSNYITNPARLLTGPDGGFEPPAPAATWATDLSWNGEAYECFLCNSEFKTLPRLNQHLQSPRHDDKIYRCPNSDCRTEFVTLSGLCQHVEGGTCGVRTFKRVRDTMASFTRGFNSLTM